MEKFVRLGSLTSDKILMIILGSTMLLRDQSELLLNY